MGPLTRSERDKQTDYEAKVLVRKARKMPRGAVEEEMRAAKRRCASAKVRWRFGLCNVFVCVIHCDKSCGAVDCCTVLSLRGIALLGCALVDI